MRYFQVFNQAFKYFIRQPMLVVTFVAVAFIPILYSGFLIKGAWDPYGQLSGLPVAIVNMDEGASFQGETLNAGQDFVDELRGNNSFHWQFVNEEEAEVGMRGNRYYAAITIPANFSREVASLANDNPVQAEIIFESNSYYNFVAGQISENATKELKEKLSHNLTEAYSRSIYSQFETLSSGLSSAGDGAKKLNEGAASLNDGIVKVAGGISDLANGTAQLNAKVGLLREGSSKVHAGASQLNAGMTEWSAGARQLFDAGKKLQQGAEQAAQGSTGLYNGIKSSKEGADRLTAALKDASSGTKKLGSGLENSISSLSELADGSSRLAAGLQKVIDDHPEWAADTQLSNLLAASQDVSKGTRALLSGQNELLSGSKAVVTGQQQALAGSQAISDAQTRLLQGATDLQGGQKRLFDGLRTYNANFSKIVNGSDKLAQGAGQVGSGAEQLKTGMSQLTNGIGKVADGAAQLKTGSAPLATGAAELAEGARQLDVKLNEAAEKTSTIQANDKMIQMLAQPVTIKSNNERKVSLYGNGIAPYFISMALFAGALVFTTIISGRTTVVEDASGVPLFIAKTLTFGLISIAQSLILVTILVFILGLEVQNVPLFYLYTALVGLTFMLIVQAIVTWLDLPGRFVVLLIMIFQLASSAGTFPLELLPGWAKAMNPWLPMTYSIRGFRDVISSGDYDNLRIQCAYLALYLIVFLTLTFVYFMIKKKKTTDEQLMPVKL
ncbi:YhgE/Pip domain-containing protein [Cohnella herbarum]|uniref:YhgE/Pip domain-containing protein n=1 Tax=Cohnella herbarum TaxID=2728023 RepID=A0A7Z2VHE8_9BACL|nr:YhgE/Pip domain-containing protein [Cohnella herbarum]QJD83109.1 YhgE/Pip domain-containing protein [Cohnella herbarum]